MENITSKNNEKIKYAASLKDSARSRKINGAFFAEGARLCSDAAQSGVDILQFFFTAKAKEKFEQYFSLVYSKARQSFEISEEVSKRLSDTQSPQGMFCVCKAVDFFSDENKIKATGKYLLLENVQDPSNLGAIGRTAEALGVDGLIISGGCDIYNPKALRASMGAFFRLKVIACEDVPAFAKKAKEMGVIVAASTPDDSAVNITEADFSGGVIMIVGNEGNGVTEETMNAASLKVTIPMGGRAESLNASTAAAILMWEMMRRGG